MVEELNAAYGEFVKNKSGASFLQSPEWAGVKNNWKCERIVLEDEDGKIYASMQILIMTVKLFNKPLVSFAYAPRGPVCESYDAHTIAKLTEKAETVLKRYRAAALICDPLIEEGSEAVESFKRAGWEYKENAPDFSTMQFRGTMLIENLDKTDEYSLLKSFKQKTRYNINLAIRSGVKCFYSNDYLDEFYRLYEITAKRDNFDIRDKEYYRRILDSFGENARLYVCQYMDKILSTAICLRYSDTTSYFLGASDNLYRHVMPNYLMQWTMMLWALENKSRTYNFMGTPISDDTDTQMGGVYRFKKGFNARKVIYAGEFTKVFNRFGWNLLQCGIKARSAIRKTIERLKNL